MQFTEEDYKDLEENPLDENELRQMEGELQFAAEHNPMVMYRFQPVDVKSQSHKVELLWFLLTEMGLCLREDGFDRMHKKFHKHFEKLEENDENLEETLDK